MPIRCDCSALTGVLGLAVLTSSFSGCSPAAQPRVVAADVDAQQAASEALALFDASHDGAIDATELKACPPLARSASSYDSNGDGKITSDEIAERLTRLYGSGTSVTRFDCLVTLKGRPLDGATVRLLPVKFFGAMLPPAEGITDSDGVAHPAVTAVAPSGDASAQLMYPGLYSVEITHPSTPLPAKYNTATELGCEVDPSARQGGSARFELTAN